MPTVRPRTQITHTPDVERALRLAHKRWPGERPSELLLRLIGAGADALERSGLSEALEHRHRVFGIAGTYAGLFSADYLDEVREGWPE